MEIKLLKKCRLDYLDLLGQLTVCEAVDLRKRQRFFEQKKTFLIYDPELVGCISYYVEPKLNRGGSLVAHIEDLVVDQAHRGKGYGKILIQTAFDDILKFELPYKIILNCSEENVAFYEKCGFHRAGVEMRIDL